MRADSNCDYVLLQQELHSNYKNLSYAIRYRFPNALPVKRNQHSKIRPRPHFTTCQNHRNVTECRFVVPQGGVSCHKTGA